MASRKQKKAGGEAATATTSTTASDQEQKSTAPTKGAATKKATKMARGRRTAKLERRGPGRPKGSKNKVRSRATAKKSAAPRRYTPAERANILAAAKRDGLSGPAAAKKFGIS